MKIDVQTNLLRPELQKGINKNNKLSEQIASGLKVNKAQDDAVNLLISNRIASQLNGQNQAIRNVNDSVSYAQIAEGALSSVSDAAFRVEELSIQAANGSLSTQDRNAIQQEITELQSYVTDVYSNTSFGGEPVFGNSVTFQVGGNSNETIDLAISNGSLLDVDVTTQSGAQTAISAVRSFRENVDSNRTEIGAFQNAAISRIESLTAQSISNAASRSQLVDTDYAKSISEKTANDFKNEAIVALTAQANFSNQQALNLLK